MLIAGATQIPNNDIGLPDNHFAIVPDDATFFTNFVREIYVGVGGDVSIVDAHGVAVLYKNFPTGQKLVGVFKRVNATNTTATNMVGRW